MANEVVDIATDVDSAVNRGDDGVVGTYLHFHCVAFNSHGPILALVGGILQTIGGGGQNHVADDDDVVHIEPFVSSRSNQLNHFVIVSGFDGPNARAHEAVVITLLAQAVVGGSAAAVASADIDDAVIVLRHAADHQILIAHLMPSDAIVVGLVDTTAHGADVNHTVGHVACIQCVVIQNSRGLTTHIVRTHVNPIQRIVGCVSRNRGLHRSQHVGRINQAGVLIRAKAAHEALRIRCCVRARDIMSALVSNGQTLA